MQSNAKSNDGLSSNQQLVQNKVLLSSAACRPAVISPKSVTGSVNHGQVLNRSMACDRHDSKDSGICGSGMSLRLAGTLPSAHNPKMIALQINLLKSQPQA